MLIFIYFCFLNKILKPHKRIFYLRKIAFRFFCDFNINSNLVY